MLYLLEKTNWSIISTSLLFPQTNWLECKPFSQFLLPHHQEKAWHPPLWIFRFSIFYLNGMTEFRNSFLKNIISSYELHSFLRYLILKLEKLKTTSHKIYWDNHFLKKFPSPPSPPSINVDGSESYTKTMLRTNYWPTTLI